VKTGISDYRSWSFADRSFFFAFLVSLLWHLFWFFSVTIVVAPPKRSPKIQPSIVSLGPVVNDTIFKTLVENRPEISKAFYRQPTDFSSATEVPAQTVEHYSPGDVISVPLGKNFTGALKDLVGGGKTSPDSGLPVIWGTAGAEDYFGFSSPTGKPQILSRPVAPTSMFLATRLPTEIEFSIDERGKVLDPEVVVSSGDASVDLAWENHLRQWIFAAPGFNTLKDERLHVKFRTPDPGAD
jgi:hypothetical protein